MHKAPRTRNKTDQKQCYYAARSKGEKREREREEKGEEKENNSSILPIFFAFFATIASPPYGLFSCFISYFVRPLFGKK